VANRSGALPGDLADVLGERATEWLTAAEVYSPELAIVHRGDRIVGAALVTRRPSTSSRKIARFWSADDAAASVLLDGILDNAVEQRTTNLKWEHVSDDHLPLAAANGFHRMRSPIPSGDGTATGDAFVRYSAPWPHDEYEYYRQTTDVSCGPVSVLIAEHQTDPARPITRAEELRLWRLATNLPGCEPIGLALVTDVEKMRPRVYLNSDGPVLIEHITSGFERELREMLQTQSAEDAKIRGIPVERRLLSVDELTAAVSDGQLALLLIDEGSMHSEKGPHWILAHGVRDDIFLVEDPWVDTLGGESWADGHELAIAAADLDAMSFWGSPAYRGAILLTPDRDLTTPRQTRAPSRRREANRLPTTPK
jgi:hypothetical protein